MESIYAVFDGEKFVIEKQVDLKKGQKVILTILEKEILPEEEANYSYATAIKSGAFNYLFKKASRNILLMIVK